MPNRTTEVEKILIDYSKTLTTLFVTMLGAQITLVGSLFKDADNRLLAYCSMFLMLLAALLALSISEGALRRVSPKPQFRWSLVQKIVGGLPDSVEVEYVKSFLAGTVFSGSTISFIIFVITSG